MDANVPVPPEGRACEMVLLAASAGGIPALKTVLRGLPADFPVPVALVLHRTEAATVRVERVFDGRVGLRVKLAEEGDPIEPGTVYVAPARQHLVVRPDRTLHLMDGTRIRFTRSSANPLFQSAAFALDGRVIAVVLTGGGSDGVDGVQTVTGMGGTVIVQDPATAESSGMPASAIATGAAAYVVPLAEIAPLLVKLVGGGERAGGEAADRAPPVAA
jgi:two-component system, chemotaxis family, protein-glutamate methylesterase/glutaminase